jgi:hypothetical protein
MSIMGWNGGGSEARSGSLPPSPVGIVDPPAERFFNMLWIDWIDSIAPPGPSLPRPNRRSNGFPVGRAAAGRDEECPATNRKCHTPRLPKEPLFTHTVRHKNSMIRTRMGQDENEYKYEFDPQEYDHEQPDDDNDDDEGSITVSSVSSRPSTTGSGTTTRTTFTTTTGSHHPNDESYRSCDWNEALWQSIQGDANQSAIHLVSYALRDTDNHRYPSSFSLAQQQHDDEATRKTILWLQIFAQRILVDVQQQQQQYPSSSPSSPQQPFPLTESRWPGDENRTIPVITTTTKGPAPGPSSLSSFPCSGTAITTPVETNTTMPMATTPSPGPPPILLSTTTVAEGMQHFPVEQLCPNTGTVLRTFTNGRQAQQFISKSAQPHFFWYAVQGINKVGTPYRQSRPTPCGCDPIFVPSFVPSLAPSLSRSIILVSPSTAPPD